MNKWLVADEVDRLVQTMLEALGKEVSWRPGIDRKELLEAIPQYEGIVISTRTYIDRTFIDAAASLKVVARVGSGMEHIDREYCTEKGITCLSSPEGNCNAVAEHSMAMLLSLSNNLFRAQNELLRGIWRREENRGFELKGRTIGIIGCGHTGSAFARKLAGWETRVLVYDKYRPVPPLPHVEPCALETLKRESDIISFHVPYNAETHHWICREFVSECRKGVILLNTSRGAVARTEDLLPLLEEGLLGGLCLDVFEDEPLSKGAVHPSGLYAALLAHDRVVATPHIAGWTVESGKKLIEVLVEKIAATM